MKLKRVSQSIIFVLVLFSCLMIAGCTPEARILLAGDSWAAISRIIKVYENPLQYGVIYQTDWGTAQGYDIEGMKSKLKDNPSVDIVILSIGGNDLMNYAHASDTPAEQEALLDEIGLYISEIVNEVLRMPERDDVKIALLTYDYGNFDETLNCLDFSELCQINKDIYQSLGSPESALIVNEYLVGLGQVKWEIANNEFYIDSNSVKHEIEDASRVEVVNNFGLMQYHFGYPESECGFDKYEVPLPGYDEMGIIPGGDLNCYSPPGAMAVIPFVHIDTYHLNSAGYEIIGDNVMDRIVTGWL